MTGSYSWGRLGALRPGPRDPARPAEQAHAVAVRLKRQEDEVSTCEHKNSARRQLMVQELANLKLVGSQRDPNIQLYVCVALSQCAGFNLKSVTRRVPNLPTDQEGIRQGNSGRNSWKNDVI